MFAAISEIGHALVGALVPDYDQVQKISIIPRSNGAGGLTFFAPQESRLESGMYSRQYLESQLAVALGGRLAEEIIYGEDMVTTGASNDIQQVASIAKRMVKEWGMSEKVGLVALAEPQAPSFMGRMMLRRPTKVRVLCWTYRCDSTMFDFCIDGGFVVSRHAFLPVSIHSGATRSWEP